MIVRCVARSGYDEFWLTGADSRGAPYENAAALYREVAEVLLQHRCDVLQEKIFGPFGARDEMLEARSAALRSAGLETTNPCTFVAGRDGARELTGVQLFAVVLRDRNLGVHTVDSGAVRGRELRAPHWRRVHLASIFGGNACDQAPAGEIGKMFSRAEDALVDLGLAFGDVARTWIYLNRLLEVYPVFNRLRNELFLNRGVHRYPASTAIQGTAAGEACMLDLIAIQGAHASFHPMSRTMRQHEASAYGSAFSRAGLIQLGGDRTLHVSGTAAIDASGRSCHGGDRDMQVGHALLCFAAALEAHDLRFSNVVSATVYAKDDASLEAFERFMRLLEIPSFPYVAMYADVCRTELMFEIEAVAVPEPPAAALLCREG